MSINQPKYVIGASAILIGLLIWYKRQTPEPPIPEGLKEQEEKEEAVSEEGNDLKNITLELLETYKMELI